MSKKILVYIEKENNIYIELAKKAQELASKLSDTEVIGLTLSGKIDEKTYFDKVYYSNDIQLKKYSIELYPKVIVDFVRNIQPEIFLIGATVQGRELAPQIASNLGCGLTADCIDLDINDKGQLAATRPTFGGKLMATILSKVNPQMATVRANVLKTTYNALLKDTQYFEIFPQIEENSKSIELIEVIKKEIKPSIENSEIIIAGGKGIKDNIELLYKAAEKLGAKVGVSRSIVDLGLVPSDIQIGQTGKTVSPKIYIACGISGAIQHTVGIMNADKIIAINNDENAPIFKIADLGIVADAADVLKELIKD